MVIGAVFLTFFVGFAIKYKDLQERKTEIIMLDNLDTALTNLQSSSFTTATNIELPLDIGVNCDVNGFNIFINEKNNVNYLLASRNKLKNKMYIWYQPYKIPFKVTNFYYLTDDFNVRINVNQNFFEEIKKDMPDIFKNKIINDPTGINIHGDINEGTVNNIKYLGREMLYAGIFSDNYECFYKNFKKELDKTILIYQNKAVVLSRSGCNYNLILSKLNMLKDFDNVNYDIIDDIDRLNRNLISNNCPSLF
jgi:hypothetical protein